MRLRQRLLVLAAFAVVTPALGQAVAPVGSSDGGTQGAASIPDFSGIWARNSFNFETPASGQGPITNLRRVGKDASTYILGGDPVPLVGDYNNPILRPQAAAAVKRMGELFVANGMITAFQLEEALEEGQRTGNRLGAVLLSQGLVTNIDLVRVLAQHYGIGFIDLDDHTKVLS